MFICCLQVQSGVYHAYREDLLPGHGGALEEQGTGREGCMHPAFMTLSIQVSSLHQEDVMHDDYRLKILLFALDKLFYNFDQIKKQWKVDEKIVVAYEILCLSVQQCTK